MEERYPTQQKIWTCPKCESTEYSEDTVTMTGKTWSRFMNTVSYTHLTLPTKA